MCCLSFDFDSFHFCGACVCVSSQFEMHFIFWLLNDWWKAFQLVFIVWCVSGWSDSFNKRIDTNGFRWPFNIRFGRFFVSNDNMHNTYTEKKISQWCWNINLCVWICGPQAIFGFFLDVIIEEEKNRIFIFVRNCCFFRLWFFFNCFLVEVVVAVVVLVVNRNYL